MKAYFTIVQLMILLILGCMGINNIKKEYAGDVTSNKITARSIVGYWESRDDGLRTHITEVRENFPGTGSFTDIFGNLIAAGKFRDIRYIGKNKWKCQMYRHSPSLIYHDEPARIIWEDVIIEMLDINTIRVENTIYDRT